MPRKGYKPEQIISKRGEAVVLIAQGSAISIVCNNIGVSDYPYYRWRKELEQENSRLKQLVTDLSLHNSILKEAAQGNS